MIRSWKVSLAGLAAAALAACNGSSTTGVGSASVRVQFSAPYAPATCTITLRAFSGAGKAWSSGGSFYDQEIDGSNGAWTHDFVDLPTGDYTFCAQALADGNDIGPACVNATVTKDRTAAVDLALQPPPTVDEVGSASVKVQFSSSYAPATCTMTLRAFHGASQSWSSGGQFYDQDIDGGNGAWTHDFADLPTGDYTFCARALADAHDIGPTCVNATVAKDLTAAVDIALRPPTVPVFDTLPEVLPPNLPSQPFQAQQTAEFGDRIALAPGTGRHPIEATVVMVTWATEAYAHPITLNLYGVSGGTLALVGTRTQTFDIPARPAADPTCPDTGYGAGFAWRASNGKCYNGLAFPITFDLSGLDTVLPDSLAYGIAYDTNTWGYSPVGQPGPYDSLNVAVIGDGNTISSTVPSVGTDPDPDAVLRNYWSYSPPAGYTGYGPETGWTGYAPAIELLAY